MRRAIFLFLVLFGISLLAGVARARASAAWTAKTDPALITALATGQPVEFLVVLAEQADLGGAAALADKVARGGFVYEALTDVAARTQAPLRAELDARGATYRPYWVHNMIWVRGDGDLVRTMAARGDVRRVYANTRQQVGLPQPTAAPSPGTTDLVEWNIAIVRAPQVWARGFTGQGAVIGGQDTGYEWEHPALRSRYRGARAGSGDHDFNWHDAIREDFPENGPGNSCGFDLAEPCDDSGHGTHTMGTMVGRTNQMQIGMAPDAKWIGCRNMESGWGSPATYTECYEWFIAPYPIGGDPFTDGDPSKAPHVINNSWSCPTEEGCASPDVLRAVVEAVRAAGILTVHSAGNSGPGCETINSPAAIYDASFTVGATDDQNRITGFSSRGPVSVDASGRRKPDIVAPGQNIQSSVPGDGYGFLSGTSMAAPHVAGLVALLISADPSLAGHVDALETIITETALPRLTDQGCGTDDGASRPNNVFGWGRIDALAALDSLGPPPLNHKAYLPFVPRQTKSIIDE